MEIEKIFSEINSKLSVLIVLILENSKKRSLKDLIALFSRLGITNKEIASILDISEKHVSKEKSLSRRKENRI